MLDRGISDYDFNSNEVGKLAIYEQVFWRVGTDNPFYFDQFWNVRDFVGNRVQLSGYFQCNMELYDNLADLNDTWNCESLFLSVPWKTFGSVRHYAGRNCINSV